MAKAIGTPIAISATNLSISAAAMTGPYTLDPAPARTSIDARRAVVENAFQKVEDHHAGCDGRGEVEARRGNVERTEGFARVSMEASTRRVEGRS